MLCSVLLVVQIFRGFVGLGLLEVLNNRMDQLGANNTSLDTKHETVANELPGVPAMRMVAAGAGAGAGGVQSPSSSQTTTWWKTGGELVHTCVAVEITHYHHPNSSMS
jgi:hypothetical protein